MLTKFVKDFSFFEKDFCQEHKAHDWIPCKCAFNDMIKLVIIYALSQIARDKYTSLEINTLLLVKLVLLILDTIIKQYAC